MRTVAVLARDGMGLVARVRYILLVAAHAKGVLRLECAVRVVAVEAFQRRHGRGLRERRPVAIKTPFPGGEYTALLRPFPQGKYVAAYARDVFHALAVDVFVLVAPLAGLYVGGEVVFHERVAVEAFEEAVPVVAISLFGFVLALASLLPVASGAAFPWVFFSVFLRYLLGPVDYMFY